MANPTEGQPVLLVIRDPEWENEYVSDDAIEVIDIDLGRGFNGPKGFDPDNPEHIDWLETMREKVAHLPADGAIRQRVEALATELEGNA
jgi:hypothetical protein